VSSTAAQPRRPSGVPTGGQFSTKSRPEPRYHLDAPDEDAAPPRRTPVRKPPTPAEEAAQLLADPKLLEHISRVLSGRNLDVSAGDIAQSMWEPLTEAIAAKEPGESSGSLLHLTLRTEVARAAEHLAPATSTVSRRRRKMALSIRSLSHDATAEEAIAAFRQRYPDAKDSDKDLASALADVRQGTPARPDGLDALPPAQTPVASDAGESSVDTEATFAAVRKRLRPDELLVLRVSQELARPSERALIDAMRKRYGWEPARTQKARKGLLGRMERGLGVTLASTDRKAKEARARAKAAVS